MVTQRVKKTYMRETKICDFCDTEIGKAGSVCESCGNDMCSKHTRTFYRLGHECEIETCPNCWKELKPIVDEMKKLEARLNEIMEWD